MASSVSVISVMTGIVPSIQTAFGEGGPAMSCFGFAFASLMSLSIVLSLAEISSGFGNVKGGIAEYCRRQAPPRFQRISSWIVGWLHFVAYTIGIASCAFSFALFGSCSIQITTGIIPSNGIIVILHIIASVLFGAINALDLNLNITSLIWHLVGPIVVLLTILTSAKEPPSASWAFTQFENQTGWSSSLYVVLLGLAQGASVMTRYDAPIHTMNNVENASKKIPCGILQGFIISFCIGELLILILLFGFNNIQDVLDSSISSVSVIEMLAHLIGTTGATLMIYIFMGTFFFCGQSVLKTCSAIGFELAINGALPKSQYLSQPGFNRQPARVGWLCTVISCSIGVFGLGSTTILQVMNSSVAMALNLVYCFPIALRLFFPSPARFQPGPFSLGNYSRPIGFVAIIWSTLCIFILSLPGQYPITVQNMNYASIILIGALSTIVGYWYISARHWFKWEQQLARQEKEMKGRVATGCMLPRAITSDRPVEESDLDEIESWLDQLERDLRDM